MLREGSEQLSFYHSDGNEFHSLISLIYEWSYSQDSSFSNTEDDDLTNLPVKGCLALLNKAIIIIINFLFVKYKNGAKELN